MSGFSTGCSEWRIIERNLSLCLISERCNGATWSLSGRKRRGICSGKRKMGSGVKKEREERKVEEKRKVDVHSQDKELTVKSRIKRRILGLHVTSSFF